MTSDVCKQTDTSSPMRRNLQLLLAKDARSSFELSHAIGRGRTYLDDFLSGRKRSISTSAAYDLATAFDVDAASFTFGDLAPMPTAHAASAIPAASLDQRAIDVRRADPHSISLVQGDAVVTVLDAFVDDLVAALQRARAAR